jgi:hypothetical protein
MFKPNLFHPGIVLLVGGMDEGIPLLVLLDVRLHPARRK